MNKKYRLQSILGNYNFIKIPLSCLLIFIFHNSALAFAFNSINGEEAVTTIDHNIIVNSNPVLLSNTNTINQVNQHTSENTSQSIRIYLRFSH